MITYYRATPFPRCRHCGQRMTYWVPGLADKDHAHPGCAGKAAAEAAVRAIMAPHPGAEEGR